MRPEKVRRLDWEIIMRKLGWLAVVLLGTAALALPGPVRAQKDEAEKAFEKSLDEMLRKVIDHGADIYNKQTDYNGCFRLYEGALIAVRPSLAKYPDLQKSIDEGINNAYTLIRVDERAHALRAILGKVRMTLNPNLRPVEDIKPETKDAPKREKLPDPTLAQIAGKVTLKGDPLPSGHVVFVGADGGRSSAKISKDGTYEMRPGIPPGQYTVFLEKGQAPAGTKEVAVPQKYLAPGTSGLKFSAVQGGQTFDLRLDAE
jgi:hypothetical protein